MSFKKVDIKTTCNGMSCDYFTQNHINSKWIDVLLIKYSGIYRPGSQGKKELKYIIGKYELGKNIWNPDKVIIDISEVSYEYGDEMDFLRGIIDKENHILIVGEKNRRGLSTLKFGSDTEKDIVDNKSYFDNLEKGIEILMS